MIKYSDKPVIDCTDELDEGLAKAKRWRSVYMFAGSPILYGGKFCETEEEENKNAERWLYSTDDGYEPNLSRIRYTGCNDKIIRYGRDFICHFAIPIGD